MPTQVEPCPNCGAPLKLDATGCCFFCGARLRVLREDGREDREAIRKAVDPNAPFAMQVDDTFTIKGVGTVATGRVGAGSVKIGDALFVEHAGKRVKTRCSKIEMFRKAVTTATAGDHVGIVLDGVGRDDVGRGAWIRKA